jgi:predicted nucleotidyltransferase
LESVRLPKWRVEAWLEALARVERTAEKLARRLGRITILLHGSYARGDFNVWSDIDVIVASEAFRGVRQLDRYDMVADLLEPNVEPILLTPEELLNLLDKPSWRQALGRGTVVVHDDYDIVRRLEERGIKVQSYRELVEKVKKLIGRTVEI